MSGLIDILAGHGGRLAVATETEELSYAVLADRVAAASALFGDVRRLVLVETRNQLATLVPYLGALAGGHVVLPATPGRPAAQLVDAYDPDVVVTASGAVQVRRRGGGHDLHPDLAMLLSTSGSTGSPKLVRLSRRNLISNAGAIAQYLDLSENDRAATTLQMSYCYGLSVIHSHLLAGAGLLLTDRSVVDRDFWESFARLRGTGFAGVPYTFELLDHVGFDIMDLPHLRYVTQAGGRLAAHHVQRYARLGARRGWRLFVMYGATEATARMAYLPPELALSHPDSIGHPIPGGSFTLDRIDGWEHAGSRADSDVGELVYHGPNVMLGYAHSTADLALGRTVDAVRTGDIATRDANGLYRIVGRRSRFVKIYGLRIDLQRTESALAERGVSGWCTDDDERLVVAIPAAGQHDPHTVRRLAAEASGLPVGAVAVFAAAEPPLLPCGKPDYPAMRSAARLVDPPPPEPVQHADMAGLFAEVLHLEPGMVGPDSTFVGLGGSSLSYVAMSVRLERALGGLPPDWHKTPVHRLAQLGLRAERPRRWLAATLESSVALRAVAIVLIVGSHAGLFEMWGGAHILLGIAGYNFGRFCLTPLPRAERMRHLRATIVWIAIPSIVWVAVALIITDDYHLSNLLLANKILGPHDSMTAGRLWFVEVLVYVLIGLTLLCALPIVDRAERRYPFALAVAVLAGALGVRYDILGFGLGRDTWFTFTAFWFFAAGWAATKASCGRQRAAVTAALLVGIHGYFGNTHREALVMAGLTLLIWLPAVRCPTALAAGAGVIAESSLYTYLTHFQVYPLFGGVPLIGVAASIAVGALLTWLVRASRNRAAGWAVASIFTTRPSRIVSTMTANSTRPVKPSSTGSPAGLLTRVVPGPR
ncbi:AMP-dependent synthetase [Mycolicibacterium aromaticivorans JS19b1 = JCM 16368]|uniref:AMP-dependent synthetase n=1 Tax=Mycolicibacterium aromaticivorans JS19b1 = JCM 16368 TaxID=1440774 RepID=A0A064C9L8_9MYCO|nr:AMP-binding protein [Mycolicibacterium aromaticivorans]KDE97035.1 AMP-dependent synthetase [Mycolicibacterium aromaticivorans JS19b1 = JCM 16368]